MNFQYKSRDQEGKIVTGTLEAPSQKIVVQELRDRGMQPLVVIPSPRGADRSSGVRKEQGGEKTTRKRSSSFFGFWKKAKAQEIYMFTRNLSTVVRAGIPLLSGTRDVANDIKNPFFRETLLQVCDDLNGGLKLSEAMEKHPRVFSAFYTNTIQAGEHSGHLDEVLVRLAETLDRNIEVTVSVKEAIRYPLIVLCLFVGAFTVVINYTIPKFAGLFTQLGAPLPLPTQILIGVGTFSQQNAGAILIALITVIVLAQFLNRTPRGRFFFDAVKLRLPVFGDLLTKTTLSQFACTLQTLHGSGVFLPEALKISARVADNKVIGQGILNAKKETEQGTPLSDALQKNRLFPSLLIRMIRVGENTGHLEEMLGEVVHFYEREIRYMTKTMTTMIEPLLTVLMGVMLLIFALGVFLPMWNMYRLLAHQA